MAEGTNWRPSFSRYSGYNTGQKKTPGEAGASFLNRYCSWMYPFTNGASLLRHHFIDPDARYVRIALRHLLSSIKAVCAYDREAGDGFKSQWQILGSRFRDFSTTTEMAPHVDNIVFH